jgi:hypothetical protein
MDTEAALARLAQRKANPPEQIRNADLYAGSPMYYYCNECGHLADVLPETHVGRPKRLCQECQSLKDHGALPA